MKLENIIKLKLNNFEIAPNAEALPKEDKATIGKIDLADYPWDQCIADQTERYGDEETAKKVCGAIKAMYGSKQEMEIVKEGFPVPSPSGEEDQNAFISRCKIGRAHV